MGVDIFDIALRVEERFGVLLVEDEFKFVCVTSVGTLYEIVRAKCRGDAYHVPEGFDKLQARIEQVLARDLPKSEGWGPSLEKRFPRVDRETHWRELGKLLGCPLPELEGESNDPCPRIPNVACTTWELALWIIRNHPESLPESRDSPLLRKSPVPRWLNWWRKRKARSATAAAQMTDREIWDELVEILCEVLKVSPDDVTPTARLQEDLGCD